MMPSLLIASAWIMFGTSHFFLSHSAFRERLIARFGSRKFTVIYSMVTIVGMGALITLTSIFGGQGRAGLNLADHTLARWILGGIAFLGAVLTMAGLFNYPNSPMAVLAQRHRDQKAGRPLRPPTAIDRVTRHPFFVGLAILMTAHALLASTLAGAVYFAGFLFVSSIGVYLQDRKLRQRWQEVYINYENRTSAIPFVNFQKQNDKAQKNALRKWLISTLIAVVFLGLMHPVWRYANGALFVGFILAFGIVGVAIGLRKSGQGQ